MAIERVLEWRVEMEGVGQEVPRIAFIGYLAHDCRSIAVFIHNLTALSLHCPALQK
jgi:hypothetical protein